MSKRSRTEIGKHHETRALTALLRVRSGLSVIARNVRYRSGEIDAVLEERDEQGRCTLVFLEVRSRSGSFVSPAETVDGFKQSRIRRCAALFLGGYRGHATQIRFDVASVQGEKLLWIRDAFR